MDKYLVSIGVPCFNEAEYIESCIESAISQDIGLKYELVISDNASSDGTLEKIKKMLSHRDFGNCKIRLIEQKANAGPGENFRRVFEASKSKYFMWLGAHDWIAPDFLRKTVEALQRDKSCSIASGVPYGVYKKGHDTLRSFSKRKIQDASAFLTSRKAVRLVLGLDPNLGSYRREKGWSHQRLTLRGVYDFTQEQSLQRYMRSINQLRNCSIFHSVFEKRLLDGFEWTLCPSEDHIIISRLLWQGKLKYVGSGYVRRYFGPTVQGEKRAAGSYDKNHAFFESYISDFKKLAGRSVPELVLQQWSRSICSAMQRRFGVLSA